MKPLFDVDYAAIEARIVCWLAGQEDALDEYRAQDAAITKQDKERLDRYRIMASVIYNVTIDEVNKHPQRFIGKQTILGCGFMQGPTKFRKTCEKFGYKTMPVGVENIAVELFRQKHPKIKSYWYDVESAAQRAVMRKGEMVRVSNRKTGDYKVPVFFLHAETAGMSFLLCKLPSGRKLAYPRPRLVPSPKFEGKTVIQFFGKIGMTVNWGNCDTYGGKLVENITQAVAADVMCQGAHNAENAGYGVMALIHDQALAYTAPEQTANRFTKLLTDMPAWADGLPIEAEGAQVPFYKKD